MKKLLTAAVLLTAVQSSLANSNNPWYGIHTVDSIAAIDGKSCKVHHQIGLVRSSLNAAAGYTNWSSLKEGMSSTAIELMENAKGAGANGIIGFRYVYGDATYDRTGQNPNKNRSEGEPFIIPTPYGHTIFAIGTAVIVKCN